MNSKETKTGNNFYNFGGNIVTYWKIFACPKHKLQKMVEKRKILRMYIVRTINLIYIDAVNLKTFLYLTIYLNHYFNYNSSDHQAYI